jgi:ERCC4-type nuclease
LARASQLHVVVDCDEKRPYDFDGRLRISTSRLPTGDYTIMGYSKIIAVERKNLADFLVCCSVQQPRFRRQLARLAAMDHALVVVEGDIYGFCPWSRVTTPARLAIVAKLCASFGVPFIFLKDKRMAQEFTEQFLRKSKEQVDNR